MKRPVVELSECTRCGVCAEACPEVFSMSDAGYIVVADLASYPETDVADAMKNCPEDCIFWEES